MCLAIPGKIISIEPYSDAIFKKGIVSFDGIKREVNFSMVPEAKLDDYVIVHVGVAIQMVDEDEAKKTLEYLKELNELNEELGLDLSTEDEGR